ncbi:MAG: hypothetical protein HC848_09440 [Limnobacter sp.]|nr:hypothetical protein [Limnobacter sp.]
MGSGVGTSVGELARLTCTLAQSQQTVVGKHTLDRMSALVLNIAPTCSVLNWAPQTSLEEGIRNLWQLHLQSTTNHYS